MSCRSFRAGIEVVMGWKGSERLEEPVSQTVSTALFPRQHTLRDIHEPPELQVDSGERREKQQLEGWHEELV